MRAVASWVVSVYQRSLELLGRLPGEARNDAGPNPDLRETSMSRRPAWAKKDATRP